MRPRNPGLPSSQLLDGSWLLSPVSCHIWWTASSGSFFFFPSLFYLFLLVLRMESYCTEMFNYLNKKSPQIGHFLYSTSSLWKIRLPSVYQSSLLQIVTVGKRNAICHAGPSRDSLYLQRNNFKYFQQNKILCLNASFSHFISLYEYLTQYLTIAKYINTSSFSFLIKEGTQDISHFSPPYGIKWNWWLGYIYCGSRQKECSQSNMQSSCQSQSQYLDQDLGTVQWGRFYFIKICTLSSDSPVLLYASLSRRRSQTSQHQLCLFWK